MLIATAGHVDHGKTTLIQALTGVDTDRLPEEKKRGLTIELGFAYHTGPAQTTLGFIDVPGHEKFIRNMAAGVSAIDMALLVVAADDGIMPQTREHVAILDLLGINKCVVAITRMDLAGVSGIEQVRVAVAELLSATRLELIACVPVCAPEGRGIDALVSLLHETAKTLAPRQAQPRFRLAVDRCFSVQGAGTVVTGAVFSGAVNEGDVLQLLPSDRPVRIREIRANGKQAAGARAGERAALNIVGVGHHVGRSDVSIGAWVVAPEVSVTSHCVDARVTLSNTEKRPLRHWSPVHVHVGTATTTARLALYRMRALEPGAAAIAQLVFDKPQHVLFGDRFVLRDQSAKRTLGGGHIIDPFSQPRASVS